MPYNVPIIAAVADLKAQMFHFKTKIMDLKDKITKDKRSFYKLKEIDFRL